MESFENKDLHFFEWLYTIRRVKKTYVVQLFTEQGSIARDIETGNIVEALRAFVGKRHAKGLAVIS